MDGVQNLNGATQVIKEKPKDMNGMKGSTNGEDQPVIRLTEGNEDIDETPMEFLMTFLKQLKNHATAVESLPAAMTTILKHSIDLLTGLMTYPVDMSSELSVDSKLLAQKTYDMDFEALFQEGKTGRMKFFKEMSSDPLQGNFLKMLVRMTGAKNVLEIGTFTGFAALNMAEALPDDGHLVTMEKIPAFADFAEDFIAQTEQKDKIEIQTGSAIELLQILGKTNKRFDLVFIDAAKHEYKDYINIMLDQDILAPKGTIVADNTIYKGASYMTNFPHPIFAELGTHVHAFNKYLLSEPRVEQVMLPVQDGVTLIRRVGE